MSRHFHLGLHHLAGSFSFHRTNFKADVLGIMQRLHVAVHRRQRLEITYQSMTRKQALSRLIDPYHLASLDGEWYLIAYCHRRKAVLMFVPSRIRELRETDSTFDLPDQFDVNDYLKGAFRKVRGDGALQTVRLRFASPAARYVRERVWHQTQELQEHADGSLTLTFRVNHLLEVKRWVLSFGAECEVLEPKELKLDIQEESRKMMDRMCNS